MRKALADLLQSKKAIVAIATTLCAAAAKFGWDISTEELLPILAPVMAYIVGQGVADAGKERAKIEKEK